MSLKPRFCPLESDNRSRSPRSSNADWNVSNDDRVKSAVKEEVKDELKEEVKQESPDYDPFATLPQNGNQIDLDHSNHEHSRFENDHVTTDDITSNHTSTHDIVDEDHHSNNDEKDDGSSSSSTDDEGSESEGDSEKEATVSRTQSVDRTASSTSGDSTASKTAASENGSMTEAHSLPSGFGCYLDEMTDQVTALKAEATELREKMHSERKRHKKFLKNCQKSFDKQLAKYEAQCGKKILEAQRVFQARLKQELQAQVKAGLGKIQNAWRQKFGEMDTQCSDMLDEHQRAMEELKNECEEIKEDCEQFQADIAGIKEECQEMQGEIQEKC